MSVAPDPTQSKLDTEDAKLETRDSGLARAGNRVVFAAGLEGLALDIPSLAELAPIACPLQAGASQSSDAQRAIVEAALTNPATSPSLKDCARGKRRAAILVGDLSRPAPYDIALPAIVAALTAADIRPTRIAFFACPGSSGALLGRAAIHRYGEEICANHEVLAWPAGGLPGTLYDTVDLRVAVGSALDGAAFQSFLPAGVSVDFAFQLKLGRKLQIEIESASAGLASAANAAVTPPLANPDCDVLLTSGGGSPWEETLEEALLSVHAAQASARSAVLVFSGAEGLGSAHFARDIWSLIEQAEEVLAKGGSLGAPARSSAFDPASTLADCLRRYYNIVLYSPALAEHPEGEDLLERLEEAPHVAARLALCGAQPDLWNALAHVHGPRYSMYAEPLGWRARA